MSTALRTAPVEADVYLRTTRKLAAAGELLAKRVADSHEGLVAVLDLDGFGGVNRRFGVVVGAALLDRVEQSLRDAMAGCGDACALGGDQFVVVQAGRPDAAATAQALLRAVRRAGVRAPRLRRVRVTATAGLARWPAHGGTGGAVLAAAERARRSAKLSRPGNSWAEPAWPRVPAPAAGTGSRIRGRA